MLDRCVAYWQAGGPLMAPLVVICFAIWVLFLRSWLRLSVALSQQPTLEDRIRQALQQARQGSEPSSTRFSLAVLVRYAVFCGGGAVRVATRFEEDTRQYLSGLRRDLLLLGALTAAAPLVGLLGTVVGMMATFEGVSEQGSGAIDSVAGGISTALLTTQFGLVVAIPGVFGVARLQRLLVRCRVMVDQARSYLALGLQGDPA